jgi:hypothetical protein
VRSAGEHCRPEIIEIVGIEMMMTRKERFLTAVRGRQPDRLPMFDFLFQQPLYEAMIGHRPGNYNARDAVACGLALDHDAVWLPFGGYNGFQPKFLDANTYVDEWGTTWVGEN